jgi:nitroreductase
MDAMAPEAGLPGLEDLRTAVESATRAPSVHNTQPWRFRIADSTIDLYADRERTLQVVDPTGRQLILSCGAALLFLRAGLRAAGLDADVDLLPDGGLDHLARVTVRRGSPPEPHELALAAAIATRHMQRSPFDARELPTPVIRTLRESVQAEGAWLDVITRREDQLALISLLSRADRMENEDGAYRAEISAWVRTDASSDGIPTAILPRQGERHSEVVLRDFDASADLVDRDEPPHRIVDEHPVLVVLGTDGDTPRDHLVAGMALGRLLLVGAAHGIGASPLGQVLDWPGPRVLLRQQLNLLGDPQLVLRMGYAAAEEAAPSTSRRPLEEVLIP